MSEVINKLPIKIRNEIESILDRFDANKVNDIMEHLNWKWVNSTSPTGVPVAFEIRQIGRYLLAQSYNGAAENPDGLGYNATGGLIATCNWNCGEPTFELVFAAVKSESYTS